MKSILTVMVVFMATVAKSAVLPPKANKVPHELKIHGDTRVDNYYWLRDKKNPKVKKILQAENKYHDSYFSAADKKLKKTIVEEIKSKIEEDDRSAMIPFGAYEYYSQTAKGKNYRYHYRRDLKTKKQQLLLDENKRAQSKKFFAVRSKIFSPDNKYIAWCFDYDGSGRCEVELQDLKTLKFKKIKVTGVYWGNIAWAPDSQNLLYAQPNKVWRPSEIWLASLTGKKKKVLDEPDELFNLDVALSSDDKWLLAVSESFEQTKNYFWTGTEFKEMFESQPQSRVHIDHSDFGFFALSNHSKKNYGLYSFSEPLSEMKKWKEVVAPQPKAKMRAMAAIEDRLVYALRSKGIDQIRIFDFKNKKDEQISFADPIYAAHFAVIGSPAMVVVDYESPLTPPRRSALDLKTLLLSPLKIAKSPTLNPDLYKAELKMVKARDGKEIPIHMVYKKEFRKNSPQPTYLYGYGSYGMTVMSDFDETLFSLLDRGFIYVNAQIRGSDAEGEDWYDDGKLMHKKNTFNDFVDVAEFLIKEKYTTANLLAIHGASAGGLLVGATLNQKPSIFRAAIAGVPFVDTLTTMLDPTIPLTTQEYLQWGNPNEKLAYDYIKSYSPYDNIAQVSYPAIYVDTGINDQQVGYWEPTKWVQKLRELNRSEHPILMKINLGAGHGGASGRYSHYEETAEKYVFLIKEVR